MKNRMLKAIALRLFVGVLFLFSAWPLLAQTAPAPTPVPAQAVAEELKGKVSNYFRGGLFF